MFKMSAETSAGAPVVYSTIVFLLFIISAVYCNEEMSKLVSLDFEVFGRVQGVFFRKFTQKRATELNLKGWCKNTKEGTVVGKIEGEQSKIDEMKQWLRKTGSPQSLIDKAEFRNEEEIPEPTFTNFSIRK